MKKYSILIAVLIVLSLSLGSLAAQNGYDLFQKALAKERGEGNLEEAIELYKKVVEEAKDKSLAAKAQLRIGICYEKLGQEKAKQAQKAFQKVIENYPGQIEIVKVAREKLITLSKIQTHTEKGDKEFRIRKVMPLDVSGALSPDGRLLSFVDWDTGSGELAVIEIATGKKRRLTHRTSGDKSWYFVTNSIFSPDGKKIAFNRWKDNDTCDLRIINVDGSGQRIILSDKEINYYWPNDWTLDGKYILLTKKDKTNQVAYVSASDGNVRIIKEFSNSEPGEVTLSPCGRWIAYDFKQGEESEKHDIFLLAADGGREIPLMKHPADDRLLGWAPSGDWILFSSDRSGTWDAWIVPVKDGKPQGDPRIVKRNFGKMGVWE